jgi:hypothetical protein
MKTARLVIAGIALLAMISGWAGANSRPIVVHIETVPLAWGDSHLRELVVTQLSRNPDLSVVDTDLFEGDLPGRPPGYHDHDAWLDWGTEIGGRYLLVVVVKREALERRKTFNVPLLFQRWENIGVITAEVRLYDLMKRRLLVAEPFHVEKSGARQFQGSTDDNRNDPSLHLTASDKSRFFRDLEAQLAGEVAKSVTRHARGR